MAKIFISYSSSDKSNARKLAKDLDLKGHEVWLDEWKIMPGQCIPTEIERGLEETDFIALLLTENATSSNWVDKEWKSRYWDEVNYGKVFIIPLLFEDCTVPRLLKTKKYISFKTSYDSGLKELLNALDFYIQSDLEKRFFKNVKGVWRDLQCAEINFTKERNLHWDTFDSYLSGLPTSNKRHAQQINTDYYLYQYGLKLSDLKKILYNIGLYKVDDVDEDTYRDEIAESVEELQRMLNLRHIDGVFGPLTYMALCLYLELNRTISKE